MATATASFAPEIIATAQTYIKLRDRVTDPAGSFDKAGRWYVADTNTCPCCHRVRTPSRAWPYSQLVHARSAEHVAAVAGVDATLVKRAARQMDKAAQG